MNAAGECLARHITMSGRVQGVGFRPFVYRLAHQLGVSGYVYNASGKVIISACASDAVLDEFCQSLVADAPPLAQPVLERCESVHEVPVDGFSIRHSHGDGEVDIHLPPDQFACDDCLAELNAPHERRYRYPFTNCTQCGPRYTIISGMPYDRPNTTMRDFPLCEACSIEYGDPLDRRFHAQPLACPECGPELRYVSGENRFSGNDRCIAQCIDDLNKGKIIAIKGIGGYHLVCDATNEKAVASLRRRKQRPSKPFAVMLPWRGEDGLGMARTIARLAPAQAQVLASPVRPIVLASMSDTAHLAASVAPGLDEIGIMLPYSPMHHLLLDAWGGPLIATSGNISGEPVITDPAEAQARLANIADSFVHHNRPIERPADDPVMRESVGKVRPVRLGRGNAPLELNLPFTLPVPLLATGAFLKNTVALAWRDRAVISPHIGDLASRRSREVFQRVAADLQSIYGITAEAVACDAHPDYPNSRWARDTGLPVYQVFHHHAHASALAGELQMQAPMLVFTWDGVGYGEDGQAWGGEALFGVPGHWQRVASFTPWRLPGGDKAVHEPWRIALSLCWQYGIDWQAAPDWPALMYEAWQKGLNTPYTSAAGRLFDAAAALTGVVHDASYEGEAPMRLEAAAGDLAATAITLPVKREGDLYCTGLEPLVAYLARADDAVQTRAAIFHETLAHAILAQARAVSATYPCHDVGLCGGVFQNRRLSMRATELLTGAGFAVHLPRQLPVNDAGISFGQLIEAATYIKTTTNPGCSHE